MTKEYINYFKTLSLRDKLTADKIFNSTPQEITRYKNLIASTEKRTTAYRFLKRFDQIRGEVENFKTHKFRDYFNELLDKINL